MLRVVLVDDHRILQQGLTRLIEAEDDARVIAYAESAEAGLATVEKHQPDLAVFDLGLPDHSGLWLIRRVRKIRPKMPILVLSMHTDLQMIESVMKVGANGYLSKTTDQGTLLTALRALAGGENYLEPRVRKALKARAEQLPFGGRPELGSKEMEVLRFAAVGQSNQEIASRLGLSISTVKARLRSVFTKLEVDTRTQAVAAAMALGLLSDEHVIPS